MERALVQESFIKSYPDSIRLNEVKNLFKNYKTFTFYGLDNTPLFDFSSKSMNEDAKEAYKKTVETYNQDQKSEYINQIADYIKILEKCSYKLDTEADTFRKNIVN